MKLSQTRKIAVQYYAIVAADLLARLATCQLQELERSSAQYVACLFGLRTLIGHAACIYCPYRNLTPLFLNYSLFICIPIIPKEIPE